jgi:hypothetical protein
VGRFVWLIVWEHDANPDDPPRGLLRWVTAGLVALGVTAAIVWRIVTT